MEKDFDRWNELKKQVNAAEALPLYHAREIWWAHLGVNVVRDGAVLRAPGLDYQGPQPVRLSGCAAHHFQKRDRLYITAGVVEGKRAAAIVSQIRLIDTRRLINKVGTLERALFDPIRKAARKLL
jgi:hypothetical protein